MINLLKKLIPFRYRPSFLFKEIIHIPEIKSGPFKGMYYEARGKYSAKFPKLAGTYEKEISNFFQEENLKNFDCFVDVGAAEGYYAIGVALNNQKLKIVTFESEVVNRIWLDHLALKNCVLERIHQNMYCTSDSLSHEIEKWKRPLLLIDIEGGEYELLNNSLIPELKHCTLLVEIHEFIYPDMGQVIRSRFEKSHTVDEIVQTQRTIEDLPISLNNVQKYFFRRASKEILDEQRPIVMKWFYMEPKNDL